MRRALRLLSLATLAAVAYLALRNRVRRYEIAERSMEPTLYQHDYVVVVASRRKPRRGEIVVVPHPAGFEIVKRVIGLPGERVAVTGGRVLVDGAVLVEPWADGATEPEGSWRLGEQEVFVLGDNRARSAGDSRTLGPLPIENARWRVLWRYWPRPRIGSVG